MRNKVLMLLLVMLYACSGSNQNEEVIRSFRLKLSEPFIIRADSVVLDISRSLRMADLDADGHFLYAYDARRNRIDVFDIEGKVYKESVIMEQEGPNGTGRVTDFTFVSEDLMQIRSYDRFQRFAYPDQKLQSFGLEELLIDNEAFNSDKIFSSNQGVPDDKLENYYWLYNLRGSRYKGIASMDYKTKVVKFIPVENFEVYTRLDLKKLYFSPEMNFENGQVIVNHSCFNDLFVFKTEDSTATFKDYESELIADEKRVTKPANEGREAMGIYMNELGKEVSFQAPVYDASKGLFYRLAHEPVADDVSERQRGVVTIFDENLDFLFEKELFLASYPVKSFARDGQLIIISNQDDELQIQAVEIFEE